MTEKNKDKLSQRKAEATAFEPVWVLNQLDGMQVTETPKLMALIGDTVKDSDIEQAWVIGMDKHHKIVKGIAKVSTGTNKDVYVDWSKVLKMMKALGSDSLVMVHNHPAFKEDAPYNASSVNPSKEDVMTTLGLRNDAKALGMWIADAIIVGERGDWISIKAVLDVVSSTLFGDPFSILGM